MSVFVDADFPLIATSISKFYDEVEYRRRCRSDNHDTLRCVIIRRVIRPPVSELMKWRLAYLTNRSATTMPSELSARGSVSTPGSL